MSSQSCGFERPAAFSPANLHAYLICFVLAALPLLFSYRFWPGHDPVSDPNNEQFVLILFIQICAIILSGVLRTPPRHWDIRSIFFLSLVPIAIQAGHTVVQADMMAVSSLLRWMVLIAFGTSIYIGIRDRHLILSNDMAAMAVAGAALAYATLFVLIYADQQERDRLESIVIGFTNIRYTGYFVAPAIAILLAFTTRFATLDRRSLVALGFAAFLCAFTFYTGTRSSVLSVTATILALALFSPRFRLWRLLPAFLVAGVIGYALASIAPPPADSSFMISSRLHKMDSGRLQIWLMLLQHWTTAPLFGFGEIDIGPMIGGFVAQAHNSVVQNLISVGLVGSLAIWPLVAILFWRMLQSLRSEERSDVPLMAGITCMFAHSMLDGSLFFSYPLALCALMIATFLAHRPTTPNSTATEASAQDDQASGLAFGPR
ncbi:O-antigen ligase family protein [Notoacmeibacter marinus]|nr:O-antigen ligase family protein [Notoacmeibacter marinus]